MLPRALSEGVVSPGSHGGRWLWSWSTTGGPGHSARLGEARVQSLAKLTFEQVLPMLAGETQAAPDAPELLRAWPRSATWARPLAQLGDRGRLLCPRLRCAARPLGLRSACRRRSRRHRAGAAGDPRGRVGRASRARRVSRRLRNGVACHGRTVAGAQVETLGWIWRSTQLASPIQSIAIGSFLEKGSREVAAAASAGLTSHLGPVHLR